jgi:glutamyl-tRNA synthetase
MDFPPPFVDGLRGPSPSALGAGDFVVARADCVFAYQLAVTVDDAAMGITEVVRGDDLFDSTPRQLALFAALGAPPPDYLHVPLVLGADGERLAKRHGATSLAELREGGVSSEAVVGWLGSSLGLLDARVPMKASELAAHVDITRLAREPVKVDPLRDFV